MGDLELLLQYARDGSREALEALVRRHAGWVHAIAQRRVRDRQLAEDVTQEVFLILTRKPPRLRNEQAVAAWLLQTACHVSSNTVRSEIRRKRRERAFAIMHEEAGDPSHDDAARRQWDELSPHLDDAVLSLSREDRQAVLLRFYQQKSHLEVAGALGISHDAARQRVGRALTKLREHLLKSGVGVPEAAALNAVLMTHATPGPPPVALIQSAIQATANVAMETGSIGKGILFMLALNKTKAAIIAGIATLLVGVTGTGVLVYMSRSPSPTAIATTRPAANPGPPEPAWQAEFDRIYRLEDWENAKWIPTEEFPPVRSLSVNSSSFHIYTWDPIRSKVRQAVTGSGTWALGDVFYLLGFQHQYQLDAPRELRSINLGGDWILRERARNSTPEQTLAPRQAVLDIIQHKLNRTLRLQSREEERDVIVVRGKYHPVPPENNGVLHLSTEATPGKSVEQSQRQDVEQLLDRLASRMNRPVIDETRSGDHRLRWEMDQSFGRARTPEAFDALLANITRQIGLEFVRERRIVTIWKLDEITPPAP